MTAEQLSLFELEIATKIFENGLECRSCGITQPIENFENVLGKKEIKRTCKTCKRNHQIVVNELRKINAYPDGLKDNIKRVTNALKYLKKHKESL